MLEHLQSCSPNRSPKRFGDTGQITVPSCSLQITFLSGQPQRAYGASWASPSHRGYTRTLDSVFTSHMHDLAHLSPLSLPFPLFFFSSLPADCRELSSLILCKARELAQAPTATAGVHVLS